MLSGYGAGFASDTARVGQALPLDNKLDLPHDEGCAADVFGLDNSSVRAATPVFHKQTIQAAMRPTKARLLSCPGRGPVPLPISVHPKALPFRVAYSSLALREAAKLRADDPTAKLLISARHPPPTCPPELCLPEGFEMPARLPSPQSAVVLLAQANRAHQRYLKLTKQLDDSTYVPAAVLGESVTATGTAADFVKDNALINPRVEANPRLPWRSSRQSVRPLLALFLNLWLVPRSSLLPLRHLWARTMPSPSAMGHNTIKQAQVAHRYWCSS